MIENNEKINDKTKANAQETKEIDLTDSRVNDVLDLLIGGCRRRDIIKWCKEVGKWDISDRQIDRYIEQAKELLKNEAKTYFDNALEKTLARLDMLFQRSLLITDFKTCLAIQKEIIDLLGLRETGRRGPHATDNEILELRGSWRAKGKEQSENERFFSAR